MRHDNGGPQLLEPTASRLNRPTVQVQCLFLSGAEANPLFLDTLELVLEILEIVLEILETVLEILGIVLPCTFNFKAKRTYSVKRPGNRVKILQSPTTCPGKGAPQRIPAQSVAVILSIAPGFSSTASYFSKKNLEGWRYAAHSQKPHQEHSGSPTPSSPAKGKKAHPWAPLGS